MDINLERKKTCNLFWVDEPVSIKGTLKSKVAGNGKADFTVTDYFGKTVQKKSMDLAFEAGKAVAVTFDLGVLPTGYFEIKVGVAVADEKGKKDGGSKVASFGVAHKIQRTAKEVRDGGYRFGMKMWYLGEAWWRRDVDWDENELVDACVDLGLQWTRADMSQRAHLDTVDLCTKHEMNVIMKIWGFPQECYDEKRYGPLDKRGFVQKRSHYGRSTVPLKEPYQAYLREELKRIPAEQTVFEIWNEPWVPKIPPDEFAEVCKIIVPIIREERPNAIIGANADPYSYIKLLYKAVKLDMLALHPYSFTPMPERRTRAALRNTRDEIRLSGGGEQELYVTEYGWPSSVKAQKGVTEKVQAQRTTHQSLMLYAEGIKTLIPHTAGQREQDVKDREHWFGFFRLNQEPKPVLMAHATCAWMIDGGRFVGDLWCGHNVGSMLFEKNGVYTVALWTMDNGDGTGIAPPVGKEKVTLDTGVDEVTLVDIMGVEKKVATLKGKLDLTVTADVVYVKGVSPELEKQASAPDKPLNPYRWFTRENPASLTVTKSPAKIDADLSDWDGSAMEIKLNVPAGKTVKPGDFEARAVVTMSADKIYIGVAVKDDRIICGPPGKRINGSDSVTIGIGTKPSRQLQLGNSCLYDYRIQVSPTSLDRIPQFSMDRFDYGEKTENPKAGDGSGVEWAVTSTDTGWVAEIAIEKSRLSGFPETGPGEFNRSGTRIALYVDVQDIDSPFDQNRINLSNATAMERPFEWPYLILNK
ncbi:MAG: hypothetical protein JXR97_10795 [Planctomycetes bacterium]|nr:hypothetical protein [Planctomycetota bacterium]